MAGVGFGQQVPGGRSSVAVTERTDGPLPWAAVSDPGPARTHNEDRWRVDEPCGVCALADGMGGYNAGEVAAEVAVRTAVELVAALADSGLCAADALARAVAAAHAGIVDFARTRPECLGMGTTLVAARIAGGALAVAHVGDSRAYRWRDGRLDRLTADHSIGECMLAAGRLSESQVRRLPARGILTRALGIAAEPPQPELALLDWRPGDLLLLCSDGLTDTLDDAALGSILARGGATLGALSRDLIATALAAGCTDNVTVLLAGGEPVSPLNH
jgi:protein phosphatase